MKNPCSENRFWQWAVTLLMVAGIGGNVNAQNRVHIGIGFNQSYAQVDSLNYIINAFNAENSWTAAKPMHEIHAPAGLTAHLGGDFAGILLDFHYTMRFAATAAKGELFNGSPETQQIQLRYNASTYDLGLGVFVVRKPRLRVALGQSIDFGNLRISGRRGVSSQVQSQVYGRYVNELNFGTSSFLHFMISFKEGVSPGIFIRPYFQYSLRQNDYGPLNHAIRPIEYLKDPLFILGRQSNVGMKVGVFFGS
jgi:hypothetical protein